MTIQLEPHPQNCVGEKDRAEMIELIRSAAPGAGLAVFRSTPEGEGLSLDGHNIMSTQMVETVLLQLTSMLASIRGGPWHVVHQLAELSAQTTGEAGAVHMGRPEGSA